MYARLVNNSLLRRRSRLATSLIALAIGAAVVAGLASVYLDIPAKLGRAMRNYGANLVLSPRSPGAYLAEDELAMVRGILPEDRLVGLAPYLYGLVRVGDKRLVLAGTRFDEVRAISPYWQVTGRWASDGAMVGEEAAARLALRVGEELTLVEEKTGRRARVNIQGIVRTGGQEDYQIFVPLRLAQDLLGLPGKVSLAHASLVGGVSELEKWSSRLEREMPAVAAGPLRQVAQAEEAVLGKIRSLVFLAVLLILLLTLLCVANTMVAVASERRKEVGLKKAIGAQDRDILQEFFGEAAVLGLAGGSLGGGLGYLFAQAVGKSVFGSGVSFYPGVLLLALVTSLAVAGVCSLIPAKMAAAVEPAVVLRGE